MLDRLLDLIPKEQYYIYLLIILPIIIYKIYAKSPYEKLFEGKSSKLVRNIMNEILAFVLVFIITLFIPVKDSKVTTFENLSIIIMIFTYFLYVYIAEEREFNMKNSISSFADYLVCRSEDDKNTDLIIRKDSILYMVAHNNNNTHPKTE